MVKTIAKYNIIILGAGPAGCAAAISAQKSGLNVLIVEARTFPRPAPGETLHPGVETLFKKLGISQEISKKRYPRPTGIVHYEGTENSFVPYSNGKDSNHWKGFEIPRDEMDEIMLKQAQKLGATLKNFRGEMDILQGKGFSVKLGSEVYQADYVFDCSGHNFWLSRRLGLEINKVSPNLICYYGLCKGQFDEAQKGPCYFESPKGWTWIVQLKPNLIQWTHMDYENPVLSRNWRPNRLEAYEPVGPVKSRDVTWRIISEPAGKNYFCLGDAAFVTDPSSSNGVLRAIMSGIMASHLVKETILGKAITRQRAAQTYRLWIRTMFNHELNKTNLSRYTSILGMTGQI